MPISSLHKIIARLNEIGWIAENLYKVEKRSILHTKATKISEAALQAREWAIRLESDRDELEKKVLALEQELARIKGGTPPGADDKYTPDFGNYGGEKVRASGDHSNCRVEQHVFASALSHFPEQLRGHE
ncbi:hypothetical protein [Nitrosovibrio tenuis]|uniref:Uncharacterized protein n=1 Tax=Nitrosovibrio tenuis TaxID=1233 RepID=A0A1H7K123_9PROT|nr:hypothetical protein [Nitrosovibrio tenuis]SEK79667.1 hypothetical protein SAMN05216387_10348 [Nitrosovibrio tenuis]